MWSGCSVVSVNTGGWERVGQSITFIDLYLSRSPIPRKLPVNWSLWAYVFDSAKCDWEFSVRRKRTAPPESVEHDACVWQHVVPLHWHKCYDTLLCKCQSHPINWLSDAIAHKGLPPIKLCLLSALFPVFLSFLATLNRQECCHTRPYSASSDREDPWVALVPSFMLQ